MSTGGSIEGSCLKQGGKRLALLLTEKGIKHPGGKKRGAWGKKRKPQTTEKPASPSQHVSKREEGLLIRF